MKTKKPKNEKVVLGWREWITLPTLSRFPIKAKIDTGARTSTLHAHNIDVFKFKNKSWVSFEIVPSIKMKHPILVKAPLLAHRKVKSSMGETTKRPVIETFVRIGNDEFLIELTLINRSMMGFRMLLGRRALKKRFLVNPSRSFLLDKQKPKA